MEMLLTFSSITERSFPFGSRLQDRVGVGLPLTMQVNSTCSPAVPGIFVFIGVDVKIIGRAVKKFLKLQVLMQCIQAAVRASESDQAVSPT